MIAVAEQQQSMAVIVDNMIFPLYSSSDCPIMFVGMAPIAKDGYSYAKFNAGKIKENEPFLRAPASDDTPHEFYNRTWNSVTVAKFPSVLPPLPVIDRIQSDLHVDGQIPTLYFAANQNDVDTMHNDSSSDISVLTNMTYLGLQKLKTLVGVEIKLSGRASRSDPKLSYNIKIPKKSDLFGYRRLKLRSLSTDPSYIREQITYDVLKSVGLPATGFSFARVFINNNPLGLFGLIENYKNPWLKNEFGGGSQYKRGILYQGMSFGEQLKLDGPSSDLSYRGDNQTLYADGTYNIKEKPNTGNLSDYTQLMEFTRFLAEAPTTSADALQTWQKFIDTECLVRNMAIEILLGFADGYTTTVNNYYMYYVTQDQRFLYIPSDVNYSFGSTIVNLTQMWNGNYYKYPGMSLNRPLVQKMLDVPQLKQRFEDILINICKNLFNINVMNRRIDDLISMIREDVLWDKSLARVNANTPEHLPDRVPAPIDLDMLSEVNTRQLQDNITLDMAVKGPTGYASLTGVKEWISHQSGEILAYLNFTA
ncbi:hypothetical protein DFQ28_000969 [Apophysomyces sp. BC1034]|nr:hypothetical protein DFQ30_008749 [Apophysomyces sp. BC1015]KAG0183307.1 hypothetical protein DFQ29_006876 [Apophysomyces sp. BC1021]KAG0194250.1 hypothetical protein DFQ28_000969 [Apophysomyces sp. BC1034]